jgi:hypothetical protein
MVKSLRFCGRRLGEHKAGQEQIGGLPRLISFMTTVGRTISHIQIHYRRAPHYNGIIAGWEAILELAGQKRW